MVINGYKLELTCQVCPEQYDVFIEDKLVGYIRVRHGVCTAAYPDYAGENVYTALTHGDGEFEDDERTLHLERAIEGIDKARKEDLAELVTYRKYLEDEGKLIEKMEPM